MSYFCFHRMRIKFIRVHLSGIDVFRNATLLLMDSKYINSINSTVTVWLNVKRRIINAFEAHAARFSWTKSLFSACLHRADI